MKTSIIASIVCLSMTSLLGACNQKDNSNQKQQNDDSINVVTTETVTNIVETDTIEPNKQKSAPINDTVTVASDSDKKITTRTMNISRFDELDISVPANVIYKTENGTPSIKITTTNDILSKMSANVYDNKLIIKSTQNQFNSPKIDIEITGASRLEDINLTGACKFTNQGKLNPRELDIECVGASSITLNNVACSSLSIDCVGASKANIDNLACEELEVDCTGASNVKLSGKSNQAEYEATGASTIDVSQLKVIKTLKEEAIGASTIKK